MVLIRHIISQIDDISSIMYSILQMRLILNCITINVTKQTDLNVVKT